jgi:hypothetical protein
MVLVMETPPAREAPSGVPHPAQKWDVPGFVEPHFEQMAAIFFPLRCCGRKIIKRGVNSQCLGAEAFDSGDGLA